MIELLAVGLGHQLSFAIERLDSTFKLIRLALPPRMVGNAYVICRSIASLNVARSANVRFTKLPLSNSTSIFFAHFLASVLLMKVLLNGGVA